MNNKLSKNILKISAACLIFFGFSFSDASAQTAKRKTRRPARTTRAVITIPPPVLTDSAQPQGEAEIISRAADDFAVQNQTISPSENQSRAPETIESQIERVGSGVRALNSRVKTLEGTKKNEYDEKQKRLALNLDILTKAEQRAESLRRQMFDLVEKEGVIKMRLEQLQSDARPEMIDRQVAFAGSLRPEELREMRRKNMESERTNLQSLLTQIQSSRSNLDANVLRADALVEKLRFKLEKDIDDALSEEEKETP